MSDTFELSVPLSDGQRLLGKTGRVEDFPLAAALDYLISRRPRAQRIGDLVLTGPRWFVPDWAKLFGYPSIGCGYVVRPKGHEAYAAAIASRMAA